MAPICRVHGQPGRGPHPGSRDQLTVRLTAATYRDVFTALVADLLGSLKGKATEVDALGSFVGRLERWQRLLARHGAEGLSVHEQRGLFGELWFLREFLLQDRPASTALVGWTGPLAKDQDFQLPMCTVEVKVSAENPHQTLHISNVRQLDNTGSMAAQLYLLHVALDDRHSQGETLVSMVESIRSILGGAVGEFNDLLLQAGYVDAHAPRYASASYVVKGHQFFKVDEGFPRVLEGDLDQALEASATPSTSEPAPRSSSPTAQCVNCCGTWSDSRA